MASTRGSNLPVFEVLYKAAGAKSTKVRIFHVPHRLLKLQHTKDTSEVFASKMQLFIARKNKYVTELTKKLRTQEQEISKMGAKLED